MRNSLTSSHFQAADSLSARSASVRISSSMALFLGMRWYLKGVGRVIKPCVKSCGDGMIGAPSSSTGGVTSKAQRILRESFSTSNASENDTIPCGNNEHRLQGYMHPRTDSTPEAKRHVESNKLGISIIQESFGHKLFGIREHLWVAQDSTGTALIRSDIGVWRKTYYMLA